MKKLFLSLGCATMMAVMMVSCSKSNEQLLEEYRQTGTEVVEAMKAGDMAKVQSLCEKGDKLEKELQKRELTDDEKAELLKIELEIANNVGGAGVDMMQNAMDNLGL